MKIIKNKTGLQPISRPVEQTLLGFKTAEKVCKKYDQKIPIKNAQKGHKEKHSNFGCRQH